MNSTDENIKIIDRYVEDMNNSDEALNRKRFNMAKDRKKYDNKVIRDILIKENVFQIAMIGLSITLAIVWAGFEYQFQQEDYRKDISKNYNSLEYYIDKAEDSMGRLK